MNQPFTLTTVGADNLELGLFRYELSPEERFIASNATLYRMFGYTSKRYFFQHKLDSFFANTHDKDIFMEMLSRKGVVKHFEAPFLKGAVPPLFF